MSSRYGILTSLNGNDLKKVDNFQCVGSWVLSYSKEITGHITEAWNALSKFQLCGNPK